MSRPFLAVVLLAAACNPSISLQVLEPSLVTSPPDVHTLAVIDRSRARNAGQAVLGALESLVTGEGLMSDNEGRDRAVNAVVMGLRSSPRFDAAEVFVPKKELESSLFDTTLSWPTARRICKMARCQGIVSLEAFDSDSSVRVDREVETRTDDDGNEYKATVFEVQRETHVVTAWRYYDVVGEQVIDDVRGFDRAHTWTERGDSEAAARRMLPPQRDAVAFVGELSGRDYARRIAPTWVRVSRSYYGRGHEDLKLGKNYVRAMDWAGAVDVWDALYRNGPDPKTRGRAAFNLALAAEREGDLQNAASWATEAAVLLGNGRARRYRALLGRRLADQQRLARQMDMTAAGTVGEDERPLAKPAAPTKPHPPSGRANRGSTTPSTGSSNRGTGSSTGGGRSNR